MWGARKPIVYAGREVWPLVEGGKGVAATNHASAGAWAAAGGIGTALVLLMITLTLTLLATGVRTSVRRRRDW